MDLLKPIAKHIIIPLYDIRENKPISRNLKYLEKFQFLAPENIESIQLRKIQLIVDYAYKHSSFYRQRFDDLGIPPDTIKSFDDIKSLPILSKDDIRDNLDRMISTEFKEADLIYKRTGGSTSVPLKLFMDHEAGKWKYAATTFFNSLAGYYRGDKLAALWGNTDRDYTSKQKLHNLLIARTIFMDTLKMDHDYIMEFVDHIRRFRPKILMGHAHSLYAFACFLADYDIHDLGIEVIISTAEMLYDHERQKIESVLGTEVFNRYGSEEVSLIAAECERHDGLHINALGLYVEVDGADAENPGKVIITDLWNRAMPLIRYEIGDMATAMDGICSCGRGLPRLGKIYGRTSDFLYSPEGKMISGISMLDTFMIHVPGIKQMQIVQDKIDELHFKIVKNDKFDSESIATLTGNIRDIFGARMRFKIDFVKKIEQTARGKYRFSICNLPTEKTENKR